MTKTNPSPPELTRMTNGAEDPLPHAGAWEVIRVSLISLKLPINFLLTRNFGVC